MPFGDLTGIVVNNATVFHCLTCGERMTRFERPEALGDRITQLLACKRGPLTGAEVAFLRDHFDLTVEELAGLCNVSPAVVAECELAGQEACPAADRLRRLLRPLVDLAADHATPIAQQEVGPLHVVLRFDGRRWSVMG